MPASHPDCEYCNNRGRVFTQAEFLALQPAEAPGPSIAEEWGDEIAKAATDVDVLVEEFDRATREWGAACLKAENAPRAELRKLTDIARAFGEDRERVGERLSKARGRYNNLMREASAKRLADKYAAGVAVQAERFVAQDEQRRTRLRDRLRPDTKTAR
jgi:hypothetical protein